MPGDEPSDALAAPDGAGDESASPQRLYLHVGLPKSGSTYLQAVLATSRETLREHGHLYPYIHQEGMFHAAVEMVGTARRWGLDPDAIEGSFAHLLRRGRRLGGTVVLSHEIFGNAASERIRTMGEMLTGYEVHLVVTVRDLGRGATAEWQEQVKNGRARTFTEFSADLLQGLPDDPAHAGDFWRSQNLMALLDRWEQVVPTERMHVVTCPRSGAPADLLWRRFAEAIELDPDVVDLAPVPVRNESLGQAQIALLREVLHEVGDRLEQPWHSRLAKRWFAQTLLSRGRSAKPVTPADIADRLTPLSEAWVARLAAGGYRVHGDLAELVPEPTAPGVPHPDEVTPTDQLDALPEVMAEMLVRTRDLAEQVEQLTAEREELREDRDRLADRLTVLTEGPFRTRLRHLLRPR